MTYEAFLDLIGPYDVLPIVLALAQVSTQGASVATGARATPEAEAPKG
jgi:hypothetical protein